MRQQSCASDKLDEQEFGAGGLFIVGGLESGGEIRESSDLAF